MYHWRPLFYMGCRNMVDILSAMTQRVSNPRLKEPVPSRSELEQMFRCAVRAPDHGKLRPWRFIVLQGNALDRLGDAFVETQPDLDEVKQQRLRAKPKRAPMIIVAVAKIDANHNKVPVWEQQVAVGIAVQNIQLAAQAMGYGSMWRTGAITDEAAVKAHLGLAPNEQIIAFLYMGTVDGAPRTAEIQDITQVVEFRE